MLKIVKFKPWQSIGIFKFTSEKLYVNQNGNYYNKLQVEPTATLVQIKRSYYQMIKKYHPDFQKGHEIKFGQIHEAYQILSNPKLREEYDAMTGKGKQNKKEERKREYSGSGPYQTQEQFNENAAKGYYNYSKMEWNMTRLGLRQQSFSSVQSEKFRDRGAETDEELFHHYRKNLFLKQNQIQKDKANAPDLEMARKIKERQQELKLKHKQRVQKLKQKINEQAERNSLFSKVKGFFSPKKDQ